ncbi:MAG: ATP12 family protein [Alphaproteobacteria bacterium]
MTTEPRTAVIQTGVRQEFVGWHVTVNGRDLTTPQRRAVVVPTRALAAAIAAEIADKPGVLAGKGMADPALAPCFRIASGAVDVIAASGDGRASVERDLVGYATTDLVCIRADRPEELVARECAAWDPVCDWFAGRYGVRPAVAAGPLAVLQPGAVHAALAGAVAACDPFRLAALALATRAAGSVVIGLALCEGAMDADTAFAASVVEETYQEEKWGTDREAAKARAVKRLDFGQAVHFLELLAEA